MNHLETQKTPRIGIYRSLRKVGIPREDISMESQFKSDLKFNETDWNLLFFLVESRMDITLDDSIAKRTQTVADFVGWVETQYQSQKIAS